MGGVSCHLGLQGEQSSAKLRREKDALHSPHRGCTHNVSPSPTGSHRERPWPQPQPGLLPAVAVSREPRGPPHLAQTTRPGDARCCSP